MSLSLSPPDFNHEYFTRDTASAAHLSLSFAKASQASTASLARMFPQKWQMQQAQQQPQRLQKPNKKPLPKQPPFLLRTPFICASLLLTQLSLSLALFFTSYKKYITWYKTMHHLHRTNDLIIHTTLFIATCAPLCSLLGVAAGAAYYWRKRCKYGKYEVKMRRKGRGYWVDPRDGEERVEEGRAVEVNRGLRRDMRWEGREREEEMRKKEKRERIQGQTGHVSFKLPAPPKKETKHVSFWNNPYGWVEKKKDGWGEERGGGAGAGGGLARSDSVPTCESDETVRRGVADIWLGRKGSKGGEYIEMVTRRT